MHVLIHTKTYSKTQTLPGSIQTPWSNHRKSKCHFSLVLHPQLYGSDYASQMLYLKNLLWNSTVLLLQLDWSSESNGHQKTCQELKLRSPSDTFHLPPRGWLHTSRQLNKCFSVLQSETQHITVLSVLYTLFHIWKIIPCKCRGFLQNANVYEKQVSNRHFNAQLHSPEWSWSWWLSCLNAHTVSLSANKFVTLTCNLQ